MAPQPRMRLDGISRHWGSVRSLDKVSFSINRGEVIALLGDNGAGKSTLIKTLSGACQPSEGQLCRDEVAVNLTSPRKAIHKFHSSFRAEQIMPFISRPHALGISIANTAAE